MTNPHPGAEVVIGDLLVTAETPVLARRPIYDPTAVLSRFADPAWDLFPALPDRHHSNEIIHWGTYPESLRLACKFYVFALLNIVEDAPRISTSRSRVLTIPSIWTDLRHLRIFLRWLHNRGIAALTAITESDLNSYYAYTLSQTITSSHQRARLLTVQRLHLYADWLPEFARITVPVIWGGASAAELADDPDPRRVGNRTPRIHPDVMGTLLSATLLVTEIIAADIVPAARRLVAMRTLAVRATEDLQTQDPRSPHGWRSTQQRLERILPVFAAAGFPLPGREESGCTVVDLLGLAHAGQLGYQQLQRKCGAAAIAGSGLPVEPGLLRVTGFTKVEGKPWRHQPIEAPEPRTLIRHVTTACYLVIAYLSGMRVGEVLNLRRGCVTRDEKLGMIFLSGRQLKTTSERAQRTPATVPWVINGHGAHAISVLQDLAPSATLFPFGKFGTLDWIESTRTRTKGQINDDLRDFVIWFNTTLADTIGHPRIRDDEHGPATGGRLRRTLAWHIVRRPGGTIAAATQYGHLYTGMTHGYAGQADAGFLDEITFEQFLLRTEQLHDDHQRLAHGEHISGPAAARYRHRIADAHHFHGVTITTGAQASAALANPDLQIHHGALLTCVFRPETAACHSDITADTGDPVWPRCRLSCSNIAYTDRDITQLRRHVNVLATDLTHPGLPMPLYRRIAERLAEHEKAIATHESSRP
ncbi:integrase [Nocardia abscessus]|uniref:integrase n=1 Tax=Nocardia abscessus TaxID=120957 RepID=UPI001894D3FC|nr:integrase [Nocardia abscessus]MBF6341658.1 integrase [Nocardia abscessus]